MARPSKYKEEYNKQVYRLCLLGATDAEIATFFEIDEATVNRWKVDHPEFCKSIKEGKIKADAEVAESLLKRAKGYRYVEKEYKEGILFKEVEKEVAPDTGAAMAWLKNRRSKDWRDKQDIEHTGKDGGPIEIYNLTTEERQKRISELLSKRNGNQ